VPFTKRAQWTPPAIQNLDIKCYKICRSSVRRCLVTCSLQAFLCLIELNVPYLRPRGVNESRRSHECGNRWAELGNMQGNGKHAHVSGAFFAAVKWNCGSVKWNWNSGEKNWGGARALETCEKDRENNIQIRAYKKYICIDTYIYICMCI
jgi:hypothetical protein